MKELEYLSAYLPYNVQVYGNSDFWTIRGIVASFEHSNLTVETFVNLQNGSFINNNVSMIEHSLLLHPLSDLTIEQMIIISKLLGNIHNDDLDDRFNCINNGRMLVKTPWDLKIELFYKTPEICFSVYDTYNYKEKRVRNTYEVIQKLLEWHFDIFRLIKKGKAIDINTFK